MRCAQCAAGCLEPHILLMPCNPEQQVSMGRREHRTVGRLETSHTYHTKQSRLARLQQSITAAAAMAVTMAMGRGRHAAVLATTTLQMAAAVHGAPGDDEEEEEGDDEEEAPAAAEPENVS